MRLRVLKLPVLRLILVPSLFLLMLLPEKRLESDEDTVGYGMVPKNRQKLEATIKVYLEDTIQRYNQKWEV